MADSKRTTRVRKEVKKEEKTFYDLKDFKITRAHEFDNGNVSFDMEIAGINFYRLTVVSTKDGKEQFIGYPQYESNGKWYKYFYIPLTDENIDKIIDAVYDNLQDD